MKKIIFLVLFFSLSSNAQMSLKDYAEIRFDFDFDKMDKSSFSYIIKKCHAIGGFAEQIGMSGGKNMRLEYGGLMLQTYEVTHPSLTEDEHFELMHKETKPLYIEYLNYYNRNKKDPDLITSDYAFCKMLSEA
ncbi:hypothetical protein OAT15_04025 [Gammaproteobacteria bacterium]|jgi:hypothetical protein|nr:hypothetical protein [Gammaproteobacteria bacterium]|tara:strand:- start:47 stop:445 length:399 start_codon:yes stop_codon:yes gene_type:complete